MKHISFICALILTVCLAVLLVRCTNKQIQAVLSEKTQTAPSALYDLQEPLSKIDQLTQQLQQSIAKLDAMLQQYATENERLEMENQAYRDYIDGFWRLMEEEYDFEGHQRMYERTH